MHERQVLDGLARSSVTLKKNRNVATVPLIVGVPTPLDARCSRYRRTSSNFAVAGDRPRNAANFLTLCT